MRGVPSAAGSTMAAAAEDGAIVGTIIVRAREMSDRGVKVNTKRNIRSGGAP